MARPRPVRAPVTSATFPVRSKSVAATRYLTFPRAATGHTTSTASPRMPYTSSTMFETTQQWFGITLITSPTSGLDRATPTDR